MLISRNLITELKTQNKRKVNLILSRNSLKYYQKEAFNEILTNLNRNGRKISLKKPTLN